MDGYYSYSPTRILPRPLALVSFPGDEHRRVGHSVSARLGLPFVDLDRWIEHEAGKTLWKLAAEEGEVALRALEAIQLRRALTSRPTPVIALGDGALLAPENLRSVRGRAVLVYLKRDLANAYWFLRNVRDSASRRRHPFLPVEVNEISDLRPAFNARRPGYLQADHEIELEGLSQREVGRVLYEMIEDHCRPVSSG